MQSVAVILVAVLMACCPAYAIAPAATAPATQPADFSDPAHTWKAALRALDAQDLYSFRTCFYNRNELSSQFLNAYSDTLLTSFQLGKAAARLGAEGQALGFKLQALSRELASAGDNRTTTIVGDIARWTRVEKTPQGLTEQVMYFRKVEDRWLIDTEKSYGLEGAEGRSAADAYLASAAQQLPAIKSIIRDLESGKITSFKEMQTRLQSPIPAK